MPPTSNPIVIRYYLEKRDPDFDRKRTEVLMVYQDVNLSNAPLLPGRGTRPRSSGSAPTKSQGFRRLEPPRRIPLLSRKSMPPLDGSIKWMLSKTFIYPPEG